MKLSVNKKQRFAKQRAHSGVHLLYGALEKITKRNDIKQAGSYVDEDYGRLDFNSDKNLTQQEIFEIENLVNQRIEEGIEIDISQKTMEEAKNEGAKAFFDEKYGEKVRVIKIPGADIQLCCGTHSKNTAHIGAFKIISQDAVSSGIKRLTIITGPAVSKKSQEQQKYIGEISENLDCAPAQILDKVGKIKKELEQQKQELENIKTNAIKSKLEKIEKLEGHLDYIISEENFEGINFKDLVKIVRENLKGKILIYSKEGNFAVIGEENFSAKTFAKARSLKGGGNDALVQGKDLKVLEIISSLK